MPSSISLFLYDANPDSGKKLSNVIPDSGNNLYHTTPLGKKLSNVIPDSGNYNIYPKVSTGLSNYDRILDPINNSGAIPNLSNYDRILDPINNSGAIPNLSNYNGNILKNRSYSCSSSLNDSASFCSESSCGSFLEQYSWKKNLPSTFYHLHVDIPSSNIVEEKETVHDFNNITKVTISKERLAELEYLESNFSKIVSSAIDEYIIFKNQID